jgi:hypothetical protein
MSTSDLRLASIPGSDVDPAKGLDVGRPGFEERWGSPFGKRMRWVEPAPPAA